MTAFHPTPDSGRNQLLIPFVSNLVIVMFLFYTDEGFYNFYWMKDWGNWFVFGIYLLLFFPVQWGISHFVFRNGAGVKKIAVMIGVNIPLILLFFWLLA